MRTFHCAGCGQLVFFENDRCLRCGRPLGFEPGTLSLLTLAPAGDALAPVGEAAVRAGAPARLARCSNAAVAACNWLVPAEAPGLCASCVLTRTRPNDADVEGLRAFATAESAKRRLVFQLLALALPVAPRVEGGSGLAFDLLWSHDGSVTTGHDGGVITLDLTESDDTRRERLRAELGEAYRTLLGHFRHEIGHYYWPLLVGPGHRDSFRARFGDERSDYAQALERYYTWGPPPGWEEQHVSAYATMHPFEDWAETFAHYLHIRDSLETAASFRVRVGGPPPAPLGPDEARRLTADPEQALQDESFDALIGAWFPLTVTLNALSRSMGQDDLYPFVLSPAVADKLRYVHDLVAAPRPTGSPAA